MSQKGAVIEYAVLVLLIVAVTLSLTGLGKGMRELFCDISYGFNDKKFNTGNHVWSESLNCCIPTAFLDFCDQDLAELLGEDCPAIELPETCSN